MEHLISIDIETTALFPRDGQIRLVQLYCPSVYPDQVFVIDLFRCNPNELVELGDLFCNPKIVKVAHNMKFETRWLTTKIPMPQGEVPKALWCTFLASQVIAGGDVTVGHSLESVASWYCGIVLDKAEQKSDWSGELTQSQIRYAAVDAFVLPKIRSEMIKVIADWDLLRVAQTEFEAIPGVASCENNGIFLNRERWSNLLKWKKEQLEECTDRLTEMMQVGVDWRVRNPNKGRPPKKVQPLLKRDQSNPLKMEQHRIEVEEYQKKRKVWELTPDEVTPIINLGSPKQVLQALKNLRVPVTDTTREPLIEHLAKDYPVVEKLIEHRGWAKSVSSYGQTYLDAIKPDGRIYPEYKQIGAETGRMAGGGHKDNGEPKINIQQVPSKEEIGKKHRQCFTSPPGRKLVIADFSQIELRILAEFSGDKAFCDAFNSGEDLHTATAAVMFDKPISEVTKDERQAAKTINYAIAYGAGPPKLAAGMKCSEQRAIEVLETWKRKFNRNAMWLADAAKFAQKHHHTRSQMGRLINFFFDPHIKAQLAAVGRNGMNAPIQGSSADMTKVAVALVHEELVRIQIDAFIVAIVHDEIVVEASEADAERAAEILANGMRVAGEQQLRRVGCPVDALVTDEWVK